MSSFIPYAISTPVKGALTSVKDYVNNLCGNLEPWQIVVCAGGTTFLIISLKDFLCHEDETLKSRARKQFFSLVKKIPSVRRKIDAELTKAAVSIQEGLCKSVEGVDYLTKLPSRGLTEEELIKELEAYKQLTNTSWKEGNVSGCVYNGSESLTKIMAQIYGMFAWSNPLHPDVFPDVRKMEAEIVRMCCNLFHGDAESCGSVTSGGTESIVLAMLAYRNIARERGVTIPEIIVPVTVHAAFDKAAAYFHMKITHIPVDEKTRMVDIRAMKRAISRQTCVLVASAPSFPHGIIDSVKDVGKLGQKYGIPVHVDCCLGGFLLPFMDKAGFPLAPFDFRVPGVTSISADTHKYGFAPKGSSVVLYRNRKIRKHQFFVQPDWTGGIYASPTLAGSRPGAIVALCWSTLMYFGESGYIDSTKKIVSTTRFIASKLRQVSNIFVYGDPMVSVVGIGSDKFNVYRLFDALVTKGWNLNSLQFPSSLHLCVTLLHTQEGVAERFVKDVSECVSEIMKDPTAECGGAGAIYGMAQSIPDRSLVNEVAEAFLEACYLTGKPEHQNGFANHAKGDN